MTVSLTELSMGQLLELLRSRKLSPVELVEQHIARCEAVNPAINALVATRFEAVRAEAQAAEVRYAEAGPDPAALPPLLGVPCSIKEFLAVQGMPHTGGLLRRQGQVGTADATVTERLRRAGAIVLGVTNAPEGGLWLETYNLLYGRTRNPWDLRCTSGGSSGGEGALVAAGGTVFGIGSDIGGSVRIPAAFCGTVGHKPSAGLCPNTGHFPPALPDERYLVVGPLCRRVADVMPLLRVMAGPDGQDATVQSLPLGDPARVDLGQVSVYTIPHQGRGRLHSVMRAAVADSADALGARGAKLGTLHAPDLHQGFWIWAAAMTAANPTGYAHLLSEGKGVRALWELLKLPFGRSRYCLPSLVTVLAEALVRLLPAQEARWLQRAARLAAELDEQLGENGVILHPPYSRPAPRHHTPLLTPFDSGYTGLWSVLGYPVTVVPVGFDRHGLPVAVQVVARRGNDHLTLAVAAALEQ
jgi:fatty acid amide hydrolase 2